MNWWRELKGRVRVNEPLSRHTTLRVGGPADFFIEPKDAQDLKLLISLAKRYKIPILVIGAGSNILAGDRRLRRIIVKLSSPFFKKITFKGRLVRAASGSSIASLVAQTAKRNLSGGEFLSGIPGTLGGALNMNAGAWGSQISKVVLKVEVMDSNAKIKSLAGQSIGFAYRRSSLGKFIILGATLKFTKRDKGEIRRDIQRYRRQRDIRQDRSFPNAGCIFRNPSGEYAGRLIDLCGLKGRASGGACVSSKHANFILNRNNAQAADILKLMNLIKKEVKNNFKINLHPEIKIWQ
ncbi:MAG: UDP-N-acetylmuramate dehydrogenase [Candidatus Omnitrophota bacterium]